MQAHAAVAALRSAPPMPSAAAAHCPDLRSNDNKGTWFETPCAFGSMQLCAEPGADPARHAADAALVLRRVEPLLAALDEWVGVELAWRWVRAMPPAAPGAHASARWRGEAQGQQCTVSWPWPLLRALPAPPQPLGAQLTWPMVAAVLTLARLRIEPDELALLEPGGAVVLPQSMLPPWQGLLRSADETADGIAVDLSTPWRPRLGLGSTPSPAGALAADAQRVVCELRLDLPLGVVADRIAGWRRAGDAGDIVHLAESGLRAALWRCASPDHADQPLAGGCLMPWGDGWAFAVESLATLPEASRAQIN
jgi:hypothetical protein